VLEIITDIHLEETVPKVVAARRSASDVARQEQREHGTEHSEAKEEAAKGTWRHFAQGSPSTAQVGVECHREAS
jgi:hypothetical protein